MKRNVLIGITSSIASYKAAELIRLYKKGGDDVKVVCTKDTLLFIGEKTLETLSCNSVSVDLFEKRQNTEHISLADWADIFVIAPISANTISKIASGIADNLLTSVACAYLGKNKPIYVAPAMNDGMWNNPIIKENILKLKQYKINVIEPTTGELACGTYGVGKMAEPSFIYEATKIQSKINKKIVVTSGGTREYIDPVRFITNASSGRMGNKIADCAYSLGYDVVLISTNDLTKPYKTLKAESADDMLNILKQEFKDAHYLIMAAAVSDFKVKNYQNSKIRKNDIKNDSYSIELSLNPDILKCIAQQKTSNQKVIGFSLTTENTIEIAKQKLKEKNLDFIVANEAKTALNSDNNEVWVIDKNENTQKIDMASKEQIAKSILEIVL